MTNYISLLVSILALAASTIFAVRQVILARNTNHLPLLINLIQELRSDDFYLKERYIIERLSIENDDSKGYRDLPQPAGDYMQYIKSFFNSLGAMVAMGIVDQRLAIAIFGYRANRAWIAMEPFVIRERELRGGGNYAPFYEDFVVRIRKNSPALVTSKMRLQRLDATLAPQVNRAGISRKLNPWRSRRGERRAGGPAEAGQAAGHR